MGGETKEPANPQKRQSRILPRHHQAAYLGLHLACWMQAERKGLGSLEGSTVLGVCGVLIAHRLQAGLEGECGTDFALEIRNHFPPFFGIGKSMETMKVKHVKLYRYEGIHCFMQDTNIFCLQFVTSVSWHVPANHQVVSCWPWHLAGKYCHFLAGWAEVGTRTAGIASGRRSARGVLANRTIHDMALAWYDGFGKWSHGFAN